MGVFANEFGPRIVLLFQFAAFATMCEDDAAIVAALLDFAGYIPFQRALGICAYHARHHHFWHQSVVCTEAAHFEYHSVSVAYGQLFLWQCRHATKRQLQALTIWTSLDPERIARGSPMESTRIRAIEPQPSWPYIRLAESMMDRASGRGRWTGQVQLAIRPQCHSSSQPTSLFS